MDEKEKEIIDRLNEIIMKTKTDFSKSELEEICLYAIQVANGFYISHKDIHESDLNHVRTEMKESDDIRENIKRVVIIRLLKDCGLYWKFKTINK